MKRKKYPNGQTLLEIACYLIFAFLMLYLALSGKYSMYVTSDIAPYFYFVAGLMILWAIESLSRLYYVVHKKMYKHLFILVIPIVGFLIPHSSVQEVDLMFGDGYRSFAERSVLTANVGQRNELTEASKNVISEGSNGNPSTREAEELSTDDVEFPLDDYLSPDASSNQDTDQRGEKNTDRSTQTTAMDSQALSPSDEVASSSAAPSNAAKDITNDTQLETTTSAKFDEKSDEDDINPNNRPKTDVVGPPAQVWEIPGVDREKRHITVEDIYFGIWYGELMMVGYEYEGYTIEIKGSVVKNSEYLAPNDFVLARIIMTCCVADLAKGGVICEYGDIGSIHDDEWYTVKGTITMKDRMGYQVPVIEVEELIPAMPVEGYVNL